MVRGYGFLMVAVGNDGRFWRTSDVGRSAPDWPGTAQKHADTSTILKKQVQVGRLIGREERRE